MANNRKYRGNRNRKRKPNHHNKNTELKLKPSFIPQKLTEGIVVFDEDPFFSQFIDIILYGLDVKKEAVRIMSPSDLNNLLSISVTKLSFVRDIHFLSTS
jgi:hypothetical protein